MRKWLRRYTPDHAVLHGNRWLAPFQDTLLHPRLWHLNRHSVAGGVAAGLFCGLIPGPFQMLSAAICAVAFRINLPLAIFTTLYTNPFTIVPIYLLAYAIGNRLLGSTIPFSPPPEYGDAGLIVWVQKLFDWLGHLGQPLAVGLLLLATVLAAGGYLGMRIAWRLHLLSQINKRRLRKPHTAPPLI